MPELVAKFTLPTTKSKKTTKRRRSIEVWTTTCIVSNFGKNSNNSNDGDNAELIQHPQCTILINPANPYLSGPYTFPYFPRGGPQPPQIKSYKNAHPIMGYVSQWGGMDVGAGMVFPAQTIDGLVHQFGGEQLRSECLAIQPPPTCPLWLDNYGKHVMSEEVETTKKLCPEGKAVQTSSGGPNLQVHYDTIIHTTPPFYNYPPPLPLPHKYAILEESNNKNNDDNDDDDSNKVHAWSKELLRLCYRHSFDLAFNNNNTNNNCINNNRSVHMQYNNGWQQLQSVLLQNLMSIFSSSSSPNNSSNPSSLTTYNNSICDAVSGSRRVAVPLLGAGCRGFPTLIALDIAANESLSWLTTTADEENNDSTLVMYQDDDEETIQDEDVIVFGLLEKEDANQLSARVYQGIFYLQKTKTM